MQKYFDVLLPPVADNRLRGSQLPLYLLLLTAAIGAVRSCIHLLAPDGGAGSIAGMASRWPAQAASRNQGQKQQGILIILQNSQNSGQRGIVPYPPCARKHEHKDTQDAEQQSACEDAPLSADLSGGKGQWRLCSISDQASNGSVSK
jgi:hypothetical protein